MKFIISSDHHHHNWRQYAKYVNGYNTRLLDSKKALEILFEEAYKRNIKYHLFGGDLFETFGQVKNDVKNTIFEVFEKSGITTIAIPGQHDYQNKYTMQKKDIAFLKFTKLQNFVLLDDNCYCIVNSINKQKNSIISKYKGFTISIYGLGYRPVIKFNRLMQNLTTKFDIGLFHQTVIGSNSGQITFTRGIDKEAFNRFKLAIIGDIHKPQRLKPNILVPGSLLQQSFQDIGKRGFWILNFNPNIKKYKLAFNELKIRKFIKVSSPAEINEDSDNYYWVAGAGKKLKNKVAKLKNKTNIKVVPLPDTKKHREFSIEDKTNIETIMKNYIDIEEKLKTFYLVTYKNQKKEDRETQIIFSRTAIKEFKEKHPNFTNVKFKKQNLFKIDKKRLIEFAKKYVPRTISRILNISDYRLQKIIINNFGPFQGRHSFKLQNNIYTFSGKVGAGKTSFIGEAVEWCLFDCTSKDISVKEIINKFAKKDGWVKLVLENNRGKSLKIKRGRQTNGQTKLLKIWSNNKEIMPGQDTDDLNSKLGDLIGVPHYIYKIMNYFSQENNSFFSSAKDKQQKEICTLLLGLEIWDKSYEKLNREYKGISDKIESYKQQLTDIKSRIEENTKLLNLEQTNYDKFEKGRAVQVSDYEAQIKKIEIDKKHYLQKDKQLQAEIAKLRNKIKPLHIEKVKANIQFTEKGIKTLNEKIEELQSFIEKNKNIKQKIQTVKKQQAENEKENEIKNKKIKLIEEQITKLNIKVDLLVETRNKQNQILIDVEKNKNKPLCEYCGAKLTKVNIQKHITKIKKELKTNKNSQDKIIWQKQTLQKQIEKIEDSKKEIDFDIESNIKALENRLEKKLEKEKEIKKLKNCKKEQSEKQLNLLNILTEEEEKRVNNEKVEEKVDTLQKKLYKVEAQIEIQDVDHEELKNTLNDCIKSENPHYNTIDNLNKKIKQFEKQQDDFLTWLGDIYEKDIIYKFWLKGFSDQGIKSYLLDEFAEKFNGLMNPYLIRISEGELTSKLDTQKQLANGELREKFDFEFYRNGLPHTYKNLSGGQKDEVNVSSMMALLKICKEKFKLQSIPLGYIVLDEMFKFFDTDKIRATVELLKEELDDTFVGIICHNDEVKNVIDNDIQVEYDFDKNTSYLIKEG